MSVSRATRSCELSSRCIREIIPLQKPFRPPFQWSIFTHRHNTTVSIRPTFQPKRRILSPSITSKRPIRRAFSTSQFVWEPSSESTSTSIPWPGHANPTPYEIFHLPRTATQQEIKSRYYHLVKQYHPDQAPTSSSSTDRFRRVVEAYKILSHPSKRHEYDSQHPSPMSSHTVNFGNLGQGHGYRDSGRNRRVHHQVEDGLLVR